ncbi:hypothetical protein BY996DRAFT_181840 [Phakopsora pachyrhizi]|nr:hypothetical protein BY996DRAFT_181840 [Phakopsora pachyrhizi]
MVKAKKRKAHDMNSSSIASITFFLILLLFIIHHPLCSPAFIPTVAQTAGHIDTAASLTRLGELGAQTLNAAEKGSDALSIAKGLNAGKGLNALDKAGDAGHIGSAVTNMRDAQSGLNNLGKVDDLENLSKIGKTVSNTEAAKDTVTNLKQAENVINTVDDAEGATKVMLGKDQIAMLSDKGVRGEWVAKPWDNLSEGEQLAKTMALLEDGKKATTPKEQLVMAQIMKKASESKAQVDLIGVERFNKLSEKITKLVGKTAQKIDWKRASFMGKVGRVLLMPLKGIGKAFDYLQKGFFFLGKNRPMQAIGRNLGKFARKIGLNEKAWVTSLQPQSGYKNFHNSKAYGMIQSAKKSFASYKASKVAV